MDKQYKAAKWKRNYKFLSTDEYGDNYYYGMEHGDIHVLDKNAMQKINKEMNPESPKFSHISTVIGIFIFGRWALKTTPPPYLLFIISVLLMLPIILFYVNPKSNTDVSITPTAIISKEKLKSLAWGCIKEILKHVLFFSFVNALLIFLVAFTVNTMPNHVIRILAEIGFGLVFGLLLWIPNFLGRLKLCIKLLRS